MSVFVYIITTQSRSATKIGIAFDPKKRLAQLQTGSAEKLVLFKVFKCQSRATAHYRERKAHNIFAPFRQQGEWFGVDPDYVVGRHREWFSGHPKSQEQAKFSSSIGSGVFHPQIPSDLVGIPISQMEYEDRVRFWSACGLPSPPDGYDDWYLIGTKDSGLLAAVAVEGFVCQEPKQ